MKRGTLITLSGGAMSGGGQRSSVLLTAAECDWTRVGFSSAILGDRSSAQVQMSAVKER